MIHTANVTVYVKGQELKPELMSESEIDAIIECVSELFQNYGSKTFFDTSLEEDTFVVRCYEETARGTRRIVFPKDWETRTVPFANGKVYDLIGSKLPVTPRLDGRMPWNFVEIKITPFEDD